MLYPIYTRYPSNCLFVGFAFAPQSLTYVSSWGCAVLPP
ncbi:MAG: hypothetical protein H6R25_4489, partial [Proteobacteria bacterium]|nr:hypothetical protein [Pseudomonadota bacterium]